VRTPRKSIDTSSRVMDIPTHRYVQSPPRLAAMTADPSPFPPSSSPGRRLRRPHRAGPRRPGAGSGQVRVTVAAAGINFIDIYQREGVYPIPTPFVVGGEGAGTVEAVGDGVDLAVGTGSPGPRAGQRGGAVLVTRRRRSGVPDGVDLEVAAAVMLQGHHGALPRQLDVCGPAGRPRPGPRGGRRGRSACSSSWSRPRGATLIGTAGRRRRWPSAWSSAPTTSSTTPSCPTWTSCPARSRS
jgi:hypothetical protein